MHIIAPGVNVVMSIVKSGGF